MCILRDAAGGADVLQHRLRLVPSQLDENYELVSGYAQQVQQGINDRSGIGLKALKAEPDRDRVDGLVELAANAEDYDSVAGRLMAGMENYLQHTVDETLRANAGFQYDAGLSPKIVRSVSRPCCKWCAALAGTYEYAQVKRKGHDVWRRHENCDCLIEYVAGSGKRETVHNYRLPKDQERDKIEERKQIPSKDDRKLTPGERNINAAIAAQVGEKGSDLLVEAIIENHAALKYYSPEEMKRLLESAGFEVKPFGRGNYKGIAYEDGGGYRINFGGNGIFQYHPEDRSHHEGAYWKIGDSEHGLRRYGTDGTEK